MRQDVKRRRAKGGLRSPDRYFASGDTNVGSGPDSMTLAIAHAEDDLAVQDLVRECRPPFSLEMVVQQFADALKMYGITEITGDRWGGEFVREPFRKQGITYNLSEQPKSEIYQNVLPLLNSRRVTLLDLPRLVAQLCGLERRTARSGRDSIDHAPGAHDDIANAVAGALLLSSADRRGYDASFSWVDDFAELF